MIERYKTKVDKRALGMPFQVLAAFKFCDIGINFINDRYFEICDYNYYQKLERIRTYSNELVKYTYKP